MSFKDEFIELKCTNCGAKVEITREVVDNLFFDLGNGSFVFTGSGRGNERIKCSHCPTEFVRNQEVQPYSSTGNTVIASGPGAVAIGGSIEGAVIITGSRRVASRPRPVVNGPKKSFIDKAFVLSGLPEVFESQLEAGTYTNRQMIAIFQDNLVVLLQFLMKVANMNDSSKRSVLSFMIDEYKAAR